VACSRDDSPGAALRCRRIEGTRVRTSWRKPPVSSYASTAWRAGLAQGKSQLRDIRARDVYWKRLSVGARRGRGAGATTIPSFPSINRTEDTSGSALVLGER
jgi:hypothetical protein